MSEPGKPEAPASTSTSTPPKRRPGFSHPALRAMGIPTIRVPSRNWMIFWAVTGTIAGALMYDRRERKRIRQEWKDRVSYLATEHMEPMSLPRKLTVYMAPPPNAYIDSTLKHFKDYIKPILTASATDFEVITSGAQGQIRYKVAEQVRNERRKELGLPTGDKFEDDSDELDNKIGSKLSRDETGGVVCVGRGAYKEYMNGLHEGWLGPLEPPKGLVVEKDGEKTVETVGEAAEFDDPEKDKLDRLGYEEPQESKDDEKEKEKEKNKKPPVPKPYMTLGEWENDQPGPTQLEPMAAITFPHIMGFLNTPTRIYRFFTQRRMAEQICSEAAAVVLANTRPANRNDMDLCGNEEYEWPKKWRQTSIDKGSEWVQPFVLDDRIVSKQRIYQLPLDDQESSSSSS